jgi:peptidoglycan/LPS O-acetylase OafA/YrhL
VQFVQLNPLTSIRFLFALLVVLFHGHLATDGSLEDAWPHFIAAIISHGFVGVSFFFVLSGFILAYSYSGRLRLPQDNRDFWWARGARILPAYFLAFLIYSPFAIYSVMISVNPLNSAINSLAIASFQLTLTQAWIPKAALVWNSPAWSLSVEAFFYLLFPFIIPKLENMSARAIALVAISAYAASQICALMIWQIGPYKAALTINNAFGFEPLTYGRPEDGRLFSMYFPILRVPEFIFGAAIGLIFVRAPPIARSWLNTSIFIGVVGLVVGLQFLDELGAATGQL